MHGDDADAASLGSSDVRGETSTCCSVAGRCLGEGVSRWLRI